MHDELARKAIDAALQNSWEEAVSLNNQILDTNPGDVGALNRLSQALFHLGNLKKAKLFAEKVLENDPLNTIAEKRLEKIVALNKNGIVPSKRTTTKSIDKIFIEEPGKTKTVNLINVCEQTKLITLNAGDTVKMINSTHKVTVTTIDDSYIGRIPDDVAKRLISLTKSGNSYAGFIKSIQKSGVQIFIREVKRADKGSGFI